jgi:hypothetical protein
MTTSRKLDFGATAADVAEDKPEVTYDSTYSVLISKFNSGDLVYGLATVRARALAELRKHNYYHCFANALNDKTVTLVIDKMDKSPLKRLQQAHYDFLNNHLDYLNRLGGKPIPSLKESKGDRRSIAYRRACKILLVDDDPNRTRKVHVMTENIDWQRVCTKSYLDANNTPQPDYSVTASEMRAAYRYFKNNGKNHPHIIFYDKNRQILEQAPWEQDELKPWFREYDAKHAAKVEVEEALTQSQPDYDEAETDIEPNTPPATLRM